MGNTQTNIDVLIIGGGCAGLSLARELCCLDTKLTVTIFEPRTSYNDDRTWCFWGFDEAIVRDHIETSWRNISVSNQTSTRHCNAQRSFYHMIRSSDFYADCLRSIETNNSVSVHLGESILKKSTFKDGVWYTETQRGTITSKFVIDTRPKVLVGDTAPTLWQTFYGFEIEIQSPFFRKDEATLMDFQTSSADSVEFIYCLPTSDYRSLVEVTVFSEKKPSFSYLRHQLEAALTEKHESGSYEVIRTESGAIPMGLPRIAVIKSDTYCQVGFTAGSARQSTGYTFLRIQKWARECAHSLVNQGKVVQPKQDSLLLSFMDTTFLKVLRSFPELAPSLFVSMFSKVKIERLVRFFNDSPKLSDYFSIILSLPKLPFLKVLLPTKASKVSRVRTEKC